ncbi:MAG: hypothetical protein ABFE07_28770 [Armatimonadia bacterium]
MKIRTGFVSNSSSQSFLIYGLCFEAVSELPVFAEKAESEDFDEYDEMDKLAEKHGLEYHDPDGGSLYLGRSWAMVGDHQTGAEFKAAVKKAIEEATGLKNPSLGTHEEAWRDG